MDLEKSWLVVENHKNGSENCKEIEAGERPGRLEANVISSKFFEEMEDSDGGISVISESEIINKNDQNQHHSDREVEKSNSSEDSDNGKLEAIKNEHGNFTDEEEENDDNNEEMIKEFVHKKTSNKIAICDSDKQQELTSTNNHGMVMLIIMSLVIAILYTNVISLRKELVNAVSIYEQRIVRLEQENQLLKSQLDNLLLRLKNTENIQVKVPHEKIKSKNDANIRSQKKYQEQWKENEPITKQVWLGGGEKEEVVKVLDKKKYKSLPDYCYHYHTDEDDLFYEYNKEICERKKLKLEEQKLKNEHTFFPNDHELIREEETKFNTDEITQKTVNEILQSLNEEISEIKKNYAATIDENDVTLTLQESVTHAPAKDNYRTKGDDLESQKYKNNRQNQESSKRPSSVESDKDKDNHQNRRNRKLQLKPKPGASNEKWEEKRAFARQAARRDQELNRDKNWYLKRKDEREIHRLSTFHI